jgi:N-acetylneuraminate synthase
MNPFDIGRYRIGSGARPFVIAEMSGNHNQSLERALALVDAAAAAGAHALKIQTYTADTMTIDSDGPGFRIDDAKSLWRGETLYDLYGKAHTPWDWHAPIFAHCASRGIIGFSTPFDGSAVDFLESLNVPCYKIASFENTDLPLIRRVAATGKPLFISTGMATAAELEETVGAAREAGCRNLVLLRCTSSYPASPEDSDLNTIPDLAAKFDCHVGLSDHTMGIGVACAAVALGAVVVEKHFTLRRADGGVDSAFSLEPNELAALVTETTRAAQSLGRVRYGPCGTEQASLVFRRSVYFVSDVRKGEVLTQSNLRCIRPGHGLPPKFYDSLLGRRARTDISRGTPARWELVE